MTHEQVLNYLLADACQYSEEEDGWKTYRIDLHCTSYHIQARLIEWTGEENLSAFRYQVRSCQRVVE